MREGVVVTYLVGIDVGTTYTGAAVVSAGRVEVVPLGNRSSVVPTVVFLRDDQEVLTGDAANRRGVSEPGRVAREFKRRLGDTAPLLLGGTPLSPQALTGKMLRWVVDRVAEQQGGPPEHVAVSHPASWGPYKLDLFEQAVRLAGLDAATMISEPEAAATYYASTQRLEPGEIVAVYDLGGGTFDAAVLRTTELGFEILGVPEGIEHLGGIDIDEAVFGFVARALDGAIEQLDPDDPVATAAAARLRQECVEAKEALSSDLEVSIPVMLPGVQAQVELSRTELDELVRPSLTATVDALRRALASAQVSPEELVAVLLVGGSSRMPIVAEMVGQALGRPVAVDTHPKHSVALGTALAAEVAWARSQGVTPEPVEVVPPRPTPPVPAEEPSVAPPIPAEEPSMAPLAAAGPPPEVGLAEQRTEAAEPEARPATVASRPLVEGPPPGPPGTSDGGRRRPWLLVAGPVAAAVVVLAIVLVLMRDGGDEPLEAGADQGSGTTASVQDTTPMTSSTLPPVAVGASGRGALIDSIELEPDGYEVHYRVEGFEPLIADDPARHHLHFFFDTVPFEWAGTQAPPENQGTWFLWDEPDVFDGWGPGDRPDGAMEMCVLVADHQHRVEVDSGACHPLPDG